MATERTDAEKSAATVIALNVLAALDRAGPASATRTGAAHMAQDAADLAVDSLTEAGLLVTPEMTAVLEAAREERRLQRTEPRWIDSDEWFRWDERRAEAAKATAAAVDALEAPHPDTTGAAG